ncbi:MAG: cation:proton antiporter subunit C [Gammaproteobacteria bacterium]|jgi:multicomponent Na+:H+ antiporter subunit C|nr:cation:proton antiporter subunit C [Gammaproteobacteria bacterium]
MIDVFISHYNYWIVILLMMAGFYTVINHGNLIKKIAGLNIFQTSVFLLYISIGYVDNGTTPIVAEGFTRYANPLPHVLILTAIVVGVSTTALGLALVVRIKEAYGTIEEDEIQEQDMIP